MRAGTAWLARCAKLSAGSLCGPSGGTRVAEGSAATAALQQLRARLCSGQQCSTSASSGNSEEPLWAMQSSGARSHWHAAAGAGSGAAAPAGENRSPTPSARTEQQQQQPPPPPPFSLWLLPAGGHLAAAGPAGAAAPPLTRGYARDVRPPAPARRSDGSRGSSNGGGKGSSSGGGGFDGNSGGSGGPPSRAGRLAANCPPLLDLPSAQAAAAAAAWRPWEQHHPLNDPGPDAGAGGPGPLPYQIDTNPEEDPLEASLAFREHIERSGLPPELKRAAFDQPWHEIMLDARRTVKVTAKGRLETLHVTTAVGNMRGLVGIGIASGSQLQEVMLNSLLLAYKSIVPVPLYRGHTLFHPIDLKVRKVRGLPLGGAAMGARARACGGARGAAAAGRKGGDEPLATKTGPSGPAAAARCEATPASRARRERPEQGHMLPKAPPPGTSPPPHRPALNP
jgi:hypothetical protein